MTSSEIREKFLKYFEERGHKVLPSASLIPENDPTVLFTTAGMQQFKRYYLFPKEAPLSRITTAQRCIRTGDIEEVGDKTHLTFFEMLGNFSFGYPATENSYFKKEAITWAWEFLTKDLGINVDRMSATYFKGEGNISADTESYELINSITKLSVDKIKGTGKDETFWSLGTEGSPGGPTVEFYVDGVEVWNLVFNQYVMKNGEYVESKYKGIDTGMGFERLCVMMQKAESVYDTDLFTPIIHKIEELTGLQWGEKSDEEYIAEDMQCWVDVRKQFRVIADHIKSAMMLINDGAIPSNKDQGYIVRRLIRRAIVKAMQFPEGKSITENFITKIAEPVYQIYENFGLDKKRINEELEKEEIKFRRNLKDGLKLISAAKELDAQTLFNLYQSNGIPLEISLEEAKNQSKEIDDATIEQFNDLLAKHQDLSRTASAGKFKGGLADNKEETTKLHTAAHLLLAGLRKILGPHVMQKGANITEERLRFDFSHPEKVTPEKLEEVEDFVNEQIAKKLPVTMEEMSIDEAKKSGAVGIFDDRYGDRVKVYTIGEGDDTVSREICGGPHVENIGELGIFKITKEESSSSGVRRIKAILA